MKIRLELVIFIVVMGIAGCTTDSTIGPQTTKLSYEVITSSGQWFGEYQNAKGERIQTKPIEQKSGRKFEFSPEKLPFEMFINATSSCICFGTDTSPDITINIYKGDKLVKTEKNNWAKGVASGTFLVN